MTPGPRSQLARAVEQVVGRVVGPREPPTGTGHGVVRPVHLVPAPVGPGWHSAQAIRVSRAAGVPPRELAARVADGLAARPEVASAGVVGDGMVHVVLTAVASGAVVALVRGDPAYGRGVVGVPGPVPALPVPGERVRSHPVFGAVWAHARALSAAAGGDGSPEVGPWLASPAEDALLTALAAFPDDVLRAPDRAALLRRVVALAVRTHAWLDDEPVVPRTVADPVEPVHRARSALTAATAQVLATGLDLLGLPAPVRV